ncbi:hypothetical protein H6G89_09500 [Oscillatoria sp. FACHB-1407]|uniref:hypothetical protein n=1 Tax=Oscillatoria sp. FACHB-1407 TaxID=2692847 RepID=UPI001682EA63|nr:hypothetical protein [Oscillatoria sp. FACHB-1407]MBD2461280.1 hypothetical protein [Oscillatoria sp. FACHB-1407]
MNFVGAFRETPTAVGDRHGRFTLWLIRYLAMSYRFKWFPVQMRTLVGAGLAVY